MRGLNQSRRVVIAALALSALGLAAPSVAGAVRFRVDLDATLDQPWTVVDNSPLACDITGSGRQTTTYRVHRILQLNNRDDPRQRNPQYATDTFPATFTVERADVTTQLPPPPNGSCDPLPAVSCPRISSVQHQSIISERGGRITLEPDDPSSDLRDLLDTTYARVRCGGPPLPLALTNLKLRWPGEKLFRPGATGKFVLTQAFGPSTTRYRSDVADGFDLRWTGTLRWTLKLTNVCRTAKAPRGTKRIYVTRGRVCASGRS
jgi:hypothetical protein